MRWSTYADSGEQAKKPDTYLGLKVCFGDKMMGFAYCFVGGYFIGEGVVTLTRCVLGTAGATEVRNPRRRSRLQTLPFGGSGW